MLWVGIAFGSTVQATALLSPNTADGLGEEGGSGTWPFILISVSPAVTLSRATPEHCAFPR